MNSLKFVNKKLLNNLFVMSCKTITTDPMKCLRHSSFYSMISKLKVKANAMSSKRCLHLSVTRSQDIDPKPVNSDVNQWSQNGLKFIDNENQFAFNIIEELLRQQTIGLCEELDTNTSDCGHILKNFMAINPQDFRQYSYSVMDLIHNKKTLSLTQIRRVLESMTFWPVISDPFADLYYKLWSHLDLELVERLKKDNFTVCEDANPYLMIGNVFFRLRIANMTKFNNLLVQKLSAVDFMPNKTTLLHLLFYINLHRKVNPKSIPFVLKTTNSLLDDFSMDELGVVCMTYFKSDIRLTEELVNHIICRALIDVTDETNDIVKTGITKCLRKSYHYRQQPIVRQYINKMKEMSNSLLTTTHLLILKNTANICDTDLMSQTLDTMYAKPTDFRTKDIERIFLCLSYFQYGVERHKLDTICDSLHTNAEAFDIYRYPMCLLNIIHYLLILDYCPETLVRRCFQPVFLNKIIKFAKLDFRKHLITANTVLSIERHEEYKDLLLTPEVVSRYHQWIVKDERSVLNTKRETLIKSVFHGLRFDLNKRVQMCDILPFRSYPFVVVFDDNNQSFSLSPNTELKPNMFSNGIVVYVLEMSDFAVVDTLIKGSIQLEIRLLERLGLTVVTIPWHRVASFTSIRGRRNKIISEIQKNVKNFKI